MNLLSKPAYEEQLALSRDRRMQWWREARFGIFVHYGLFSQIGRNEWVQALEAIPPEEYAALANSFSPKPGAPREWAALAKKAGAKYMVLTTRHHEGFSLWDSKVNPFNSVNYGPHRDIVREFVDACHEYDLKVGLYSSLMDWSREDAWQAAYDSKARAGFQQYLLDLNTELLTNYGKIDILWYDMAAPMDSYSGWNTLEMNQRLRQLQPDIIINNRGKLDEDFGTPEEHIAVEKRDWESCMTFNGISWCYTDSEQVAPYSYSAQQILRMLCTCTAGAGNLLLNIGPTPDGSVPLEAVAPLTTVGKWLEVNGKAAYGKVVNTGGNTAGGNGVCGATCTGNSVFLWNWIWPGGGEMGIGGYISKPKAVRYVHNGQPIDFEHKGHRIILKNLPARSPAPVAGITAIELEFDEKPKYCFASYYPQLNNGRKMIENRL